MSEPWTSIDSELSKIKKTKSSNTLSACNICSTIGKSDHQMSVAYYFCGCVEDCNIQFKQLTCKVSKARRQFISDKSHVEHIQTATSRGISEDMKKMSFLTAISDPNKFAGEL